MFLVLYVTTFVSLSQFTFFLTVMVIIVFLSDYPTGALGDVIGQRWVLFIGYLFISITYLAFYLSQSFEFFLLAYIFFSFGLSQQSGALESWFDNNYKISAEDYDPEEKIYGFFLSRSEAIIYLVIIPAILLGGVIASTISRTIVFFIQSLGYLLLAVISLVLMNNFKSNLSPMIAADKDEGKKSEIKDFRKVFWEGIRFAISSKKVFLLLMSVVLLSVARMIWAQFLLFFIYFGFAGSDFIVGVFRSVVFLITFGLQISSGRISKRISSSRTMGLLIGLWGLLFFGGYLILLLIFPLRNSFNPVALLIILLIIVPLGNFITILIYIIKNKLFLKMIPSEIRNSVYSLVPTVTSLLFGIMIIIVGIVSEMYNFIGVLAIIIIIVEIGALLQFFPVKKDKNSYQEND
ncbi:MAG: hypothetical protein HeimC3_17270 [Candidatus Heimdallarchaeota archaeon LC_3]|nr:MAG: hypothetical protein HeimC3_17270 [Candidatus Heimdallarchaeota archaeon LC_3]